MEIDTAGLGGKASVQGSCSSRQHHRGGSENPHSQSMAAESIQTLDTATTQWSSAGGRGGFGRKLLNSTEVTGPVVCGGGGGHYNFTRTEDDSP